MPCKCFSTWACLTRYCTQHLAAHAACLHGPVNGHCHTEHLLSLSSDVQQIQEPDPLHFKIESMTAETIRLGVSLYNYSSMCINLSLTY